uniref:Deoxyuridine 5'-triphosphate nucleotidohydrolase n=1 Tax=Aureoumbra lagunensis TaxID=44058 RepID=A0A7S3JS76_9STRA|mmetsp:Transcript_939/g.1175  ORF Transcript_939/g.1175 Transcript_939/m.1175 type:complete len:187 (+) Transcript_939:97-657(+)|eukprot:CAMPEP_0197295570 /NCGR_PEP_ID=MMETSP0890-20130614/35916_1 /TAXON_ID=44058 ORGANISM="Aureoumbra lagunensis, Strain CCMP1510" /NCGR_SAMPLE_ID=MMETSP0890 /ASSEMBLY_ACC=CAM_ASM_000533 /LENGTH=186 /DNA_ID=CAMNT_0042771641 /DNA_START=107 /DNA_END=667 /DNA_ORIENTATION=-
MELFVKRLSENAILPVKGSELAAGFDLAAAETQTVPPHGKALVKTDLAIATPTDCYARIAPRSGLAWKKFIDVGAGVVDADYRGNVGVILFNHSDEPFLVSPGDRIAQLILEKVHLDSTVKEVAELPSTSRGSGGFGSTGMETAEPATKKARAISPPVSQVDRIIANHEEILKRLQALEASLANKE